MSGVAPIPHPPRLLAILEVMRLNDPWWVQEARERIEISPGVWRRCHEATTPAEQEGQQALFP